MALDESVDELLLSEVEKQLGRKVKLSSSVYEFAVIEIESDRA